MSAAVAASAGVTDPIHGPNRPVVKGEGRPALRDCHVLLVDDERLCRTVLTSLLRKCGYRGGSGWAHPPVKLLAPLRAFMLSIDLLCGQHLRVRVALQSKWLASR
jgi:hypothetical protein